MTDRISQLGRGVRATGPKPGTAARPDPMDELVSIYAYRSVAAIESVTRRVFARWRLWMQRPLARAGGRSDASR